MHFECELGLDPFTLWFLSLSRSASRRALFQCGFGCGLSICRTAFQSTVASCDRFFGLAMTAKQTRTKHRNDARGAMKIFILYAFRVCLHTAHCSRLHRMCPNTMEMSYGMAPVADCFQIISLLDVPPLSLLQTEMV